MAEQMIAALDRAILVTPPTQDRPDLSLSTAYRVAAESTRLRRERGELPVGRKVGYTNRNMWAEYNVHQPIWAHVFANTVSYTSDDSGVCSLARMVAPRIEPEIAFKLSAAPPTGCGDPEEILRSVEWIARTFEIVDCHFPHWKFQAADSVMDFGHHAALIVGEPHEVTEKDIPQLARGLRDCQIRLFKDGSLVETGVGGNALGHPALALALLTDVVASQPEAEPLEIGEIITTGTLTTPFPVQPSQIWRTEVEGLPLPPLTVRFIAGQVRLAN